jgi:uncharacterized Zn-binding protein involved in type VI secretion
VGASGQKVAWVGHWVCCCGQVVGPVETGQTVSCPLQLVTLAAVVQIVGSSGHWVAICGQEVCVTGHWVAATGHSVTMRGHWVAVFGQLVACVGQSV